MKNKKFWKKTQLYKKRNSMHWKLVRVPRIVVPLSTHITIKLNVILIYATFCVKYARTWIFSEPCFLVWGQNRRFCTYTRKYGSEKIRILTYFMQCIFHALSLYVENMSHWKRAFWHIDTVVGQNQNSDR